MAGRRLHLRERLALRLAGWSRRLLQVPEFAADPFDSGCIYCGIDCNDPQNDHAPDCPSTTDVYPVRREELWPDGPACCDRCGATLWPGDSYSHVRIEVEGVEDFDIREVTCTGCALLAEIKAEIG